MTFWRVDRFNRQANGWWHYDYATTRNDARARVARLRKMYPALRFRIVREG